MARSHAHHPGIGMADVAIAGKRALQRCGDSSSGAQIEWCEEHRRVEECCPCRPTTRISRSTGDISPSSTISCCSVYSTGV